MGKASKATRKFAASGQLKKTIQSRKKHQQIQKRFKSRRGAKGQSNKTHGENIGDDDDDEEDEEAHEDMKKDAKQTKGMSVDDILGASFMEEEGSDEEGDQDMDSSTSKSDDEEYEEGEDVDDDQSFAEIDEFDDEGEAHLFELSKLAEKDPEFYKYLQENDRELLEFDPNQLADDNDEDGEDEDEQMDEDRLPVLTKDLLRSWQKALLQRSLRALRKLLVAFRSAAHMNEEDQIAVWRIDTSSVYNKLVTTALRYTPVVLEHHIPYKTLPNGKFKPPTQSAKQKALQKLVLSYFYNVIHVLSQLTDNEMLQLAIAESAKLLPYIVTSRKAVKLYLKKCLEFWSSAEDTVRIAAFIAIRRMASSTDNSILDLVFKSIYLELVRSSKSSTSHKLPSINLMKNLASELYCLDHAAAYQHAFGYIRQLAIHLRNSMKAKTKEAYKQVYNWQYVHSVDFWSLVLARACDVRERAGRGGEDSEMKPLIYPLVQVSLGAIKLISSPRNYPFHLHIARSLLHLGRHTHTYIPLSPFLIPIVTSSLTSSAKPKSSTLRQLEFENYIRTPAQYIKTHVYTEGLVEETCFVLGEWLESSPVHGSVAFPEIVVPIIVLLRKALKSAKLKSKGALGKEAGVVKILLERVEESARWVEHKRKGINFAPGKMSEVENWETEVKIDGSPLSKYLKVQRKVREKRKKLIEQAREEEGEILEE